MELDRDALTTTYRTGLLEDTLPFWIRHSVDREFGGFMTGLDRDGTVVETDKGVWQQGRFTWLLGELYNNFERRAEWLELAQLGVQFLDSHCCDPSDGRMWFEVTRAGKPLRKRRYAFSEAFAALAYGEIAQATGDDRRADQARDKFTRFLNHQADQTEFGAKFTDTRPTRSIGQPMIAINVAQELRSSIKLPDADAIIDDAIAEIERYHVHPDIECVMETVGSEGERLDHYEGRTLNPGHAIEASWFIMIEGHHRKDDRLISLGCRMLDWMWRRGWDNEFGGLLYFTSTDGRPIQQYWHDMKFWWPHNETIMATLLAYLLTGEARYARRHQQIHNWSYDHFPDREHGEWFGYLRRDGSVSNTCKGNLWKGPFHLPRMQLRCWQWLDELAAGDE